MNDWSVQLIHNRIRAIGERDRARRAKRQLFVLWLVFSVIPCWGIAALAVYHFAFQP